MEIILRSYFGDGSGVTDDLLGKEKSCLVCDADDKLLLVGEILSLLAQGADFTVSFVEE